MPTLQRGMSGRSAFVFLQRFKNRLGRPILAVLVALLFSGILIFVTSSGDVGSRFSSVLAGYQYLYLGSFGNFQSVSDTLVETSALIFTGLSVALAFRGGLFNIGAEGQLTVGAVTAAFIALKAPTLPGWILVPLMILGSALVGAFWGALVGFLKAWRGAHEVVTSIMLNWIAFNAAAAMVDGPLKAPNLVQQTLPIPTQAQLPALATLYNQTLGTFLPQIANPLQYTVDVSIFFAVIALVFYWFLTTRTAFGYELRVIGQNPQAARYAGIGAKKTIVLTMAIAGAFSALAGAFQLMGQPTYQLIGISFSTDGTGFNAIGVALLGQTTAVGVLLASLLFGGLAQAAPYMSLLAHIPADIVYIVQALVLFFISIEFVPVLRRIWPGWGRRSKLASSEIQPEVASVSVDSLAVEDVGTAGGTVPQSNHSISLNSQEE